VVQYVPAKGEGRLIDVFDGAQPLKRAEAEQKVIATSGRPLRDKDLAPATKQAIITRMLSNLLRIAQDEHDVEGMLRYVEAMVAVAPEAAEERWMRAVLRYETGRRQGALKDADWLLSHQPDGIDLDRVRKLHRLLLEEPRIEDRR
jgi:regulator of sirC expression with transglutaminase-like and TPR domain